LFLSLFLSLSYLIWHYASIISLWNQKSCTKTSSWLLQSFKTLSGQSSKTGRKFRTDIFATIFLHIVTFFKTFDNNVF
jgi:hypothetical protein